MLARKFYLKWVNILETNKKSNFVFSYNINSTQCCISNVLTRIKLAIKKYPIRQENKIFLLKITNISRIHKIKTNILETLGTEC